MVDINQSLDLCKAPIFCNANDYMGLEWIEELMVDDDFVGFAELAAKLKTHL